MNTAILITARLKSTRLPMKVIKPILGRPMICHMLDRLKLAQRPQKIIICTSPLAQDDPLEEIADQEAVYCFRGPPDDVLLRLTRASAQFGVDIVVSCTADNPFVDPVYIDRLVDLHIAERNDYSRVEGLPFGTFSYALSYPAMVRACQIKAETDTEVWGGYFTQTGQFKTGVLQVTDPAVRRPDLRLTVDTPEDFELVTRIFDELYRDERIFSLTEIVALLDDRPDLRAINAQVKQKAAKPISLKDQFVTDEG
jgi:spore coat polysaccharide biosynthesis protein SpsF